MGFEERWCCVSDRKLCRQHIDKLKLSGLSDETIRLAGVYSETDPDRVSKLLAWEFPAKALGPCLVFPFVDTKGEPTTYSRVRPDKPRLVNGKLAKYESPVGRPNEVYLPALARSVMADATIPLLFTEGEKKSLAADQAGFACIGCVGVWGWQEKREKDDDPRKLHPDIAAFNLKGRLVYIVFDSDALFKYEIRVAEWEFARVLTEAGANVKIVRLPTAKLGGPKVGLDDYLLAHGKDGLQRRLDEGTAPAIPVPGFSNTILRPNPEKPAEPRKVPRSMAEMAAELVGKSEGWPRCVAGSLVVPDITGVRAIENTNQLFAYIGGVFGNGSTSGVTWDKGPGHAAKQEFHEYLSAECERFIRADTLPHVPPVDGILYTTTTPVPDGKFEALSTFMDFFSPATTEDASLLLACLLTPLWGGPPGKRPAFLFEGVEDDKEGGRGTGKTAAAQKCAIVYGGAFDIDASEAFPRTRSRLLTPGAGSYRILLMDNVKTFRLSSADLESLVTSPNVNGHRLYHGQAAVPNYYTLFITLNGASLSKDFAQRVIPIRFTRAKYRSGWEAEVDDFLSKNRDRLIGDLIGVMNRNPAKLAKVTRWVAWETEVLARVEHPSRCMAMIDKRTAGMDADSEDADRVRETLAEVLRQMGCSAPGESRYLLTSAATTQLVNRSLSKRYDAGQASAQIKALGIPEMRKSDRKGLRYWEWRGDEFVDLEAGVAPSVIGYDPEFGSWSLDGEEKTPRIRGQVAQGSYPTFSGSRRDRSSDN